MAEVTVDFIAKEPDDSLWRMVLVEQGPWAQGSIESNLKRLQERLYRCIDVALDGGLWRLYPDSYGKPVTVQLDCYNVPKAEVTEFFNRFAAGAMAAPDYAKALQGNPYVATFAFEINCANVG